MSELDPELFAPGPARDGRFDVKARWSEMDNLPAEDERAMPEFLHRQMNEEVNGIEIAARNLTDFPEAPWELRMEIARQCWDEARHVVAFRQAFERRGTSVGDFPVLNFQYRITTRLPTLEGRLTVQNRSFEAAGLDAIKQAIDGARSSGNPDLAELFETQLADEMQHVRYANQWLERLATAGGPRSVFAVVSAVSHADEALRVIAGDAVVEYPVADELRREAGFSEAEIEAVRLPHGR